MLLLELLLLLRHSLWEGPVLLLLNRCGLLVHHLGTQDRSSGFALRGAGLQL